jgi:lipopolysaccharide transport system permease protein
MSVNEIIIEPGRTEQNYWRDLWRYRELFRMLAWRDFAVRYRQTVIGVAWAVIRPALVVVIFTIIFGKVAKLPSEANAPYALMVFAGMLPWTFFSTALMDASNSVVSNTSLITKIYFPRIIIPIATVVVAFVDFGIGLLILAVMMTLYGYAPGWQILLLPAFTLAAFVASVGPGLWVTAVNVRYRDFRYVIPFLVQFGLYVSPVGFSSSVVPERWRFVYSLNPLVGIIDGFRWCILRGETSFYWSSFLTSLTVIVLMLLFGMRQFRRLEKSFEDLI